MRGVRGAHLKVAVFKRKYSHILLLFAFYIRHSSVKEPNKQIAHWLEDLVPYHLMESWLGVQNANTDVPSPMWPYWERWEELGSTHEGDRPVRRRSSTQQLRAMQHQDAALRLMMQWSELGQKPHWDEVPGCSSTTKEGCCAPKSLERGSYGRRKEQGSGSKASKIVSAQGCPRKSWGKTLWSLDPTHPSPTAMLYCYSLDCYARTKATDSILAVNMAKQHKWEPEKSVNH